MEERESADALKKAGTCLLLDFRSVLKQTNIYPNTESQSSQNWQIKCEQYRPDKNDTNVVISGILTFTDTPLPEGPTLNTQQRACLAREHWTWNGKSDMCLKTAWQCSDAFNDTFIHHPLHPRDGTVVKLVTDRDTIIHPSTVRNCYILQKQKQKAPTRKEIWKETKRAIIQSSISSCNIGSQPLPF